MICKIDDVYRQDVVAALKDERRPASITIARAAPPRGAEAFVVADVVADRMGLGFDQDGVVQAIARSGGFNNGAQPGRTRDVSVWRRRCMFQATRRGRSPWDDRGDAGPSATRRSAGR